jgi:hypothetical protein
MMKIKKYLSLYIKPNHLPMIKTLQNRITLFILSALVIFFFTFSVTPPIVTSFVPTTLTDFFLPGSQPNQSGTILSPDLCDNCHGGYDLAVEPAYNWRGSMMAHAQRDPLYLACLAVSNQDAPDVGDLCIRCHTPKGWLEGRSTPTSGSALTAADRESVQCHFCHKMIAPTPIGTNPYPDDVQYVTDPPGSQVPTYTIDQAYLQTISTTIPPDNANGMYVVDNNDNRRGPYFNPPATHTVAYSPFHPDANLCGTCHDVSNPVYNTVRDGSGNITGYEPNNFNSPSPDFSPYEMFPIERTFSEWSMSAYNTPTGISGTWFGGNKSFVSTCQDCHMKDVTGKGCNKNAAPIRTDLPLHDMTGGNTFIPGLLPGLFPTETNDAALQSGVLRARAMLQHAATLQLTPRPSLSRAVVKVTNETAHKLPSGYPEGRRIWIHLTASSTLTDESFESGNYNASTGYLNKTGAKVYAVKPGLSPGIAAITGLPAGESFHFVLNDTIYYDNRIPPRGFTNANFNTIQSPPVGYAYADGMYWDTTVYIFPFEPDQITVTLYYQSTSKEYIEFLRDENVTNSAGIDMYNLWNDNGKSAPEIMATTSWTGVTRWTGSASVYWSDPGNWDNNLPTAQKNALITAAPANQPILNASTTCNNLIVEDGATLSISNNSTLTVHGQVIIKGSPVSAGCINNAKNIDLDLKRE